MNVVYRPLNSRKNGSKKPVCNGRLFRGVVSDKNQITSVSSGYKCKYFIFNNEVNILVHIFTYILVQKYR